MANPNAPPNGQENSFLSNLEIRLEWFFRIVVFNWVKLLSPHQGLFNEKAHQFTLPYLWHTGFFELVGRGYYGQSK
jgi:hypothetical protein